MPQVEIYINRELVELKGDESIEVDYSIFDINKIGSRGGARSYEFDLPKTNLNKRVLENPEVVNNTSALPYTRLPALILIDGVDVLIRFAEIESAGAVYSVRMYGANSDLFNTLKDLKLNQLDLSEFDHYWNLENIVAALDNTEGYIYPLIDYHLDSPNSFINNDNRTVRADYILPSLFYNTILEKIFEATDYTYTNEIEDDTADVIIPAFHQAESNFFAPKKYSGIFENDLAFFVTNELTPILPIPFPIDSIVQYLGNYYLIPYNDNISFYPFNNSLYFEDLVDFDVTISFEVNNTSGTQLYLKVLYVEGVDINNIYANPQLDIINVPVGVSTITQTYRISLTQKNVFFGITLRTNATNQLEIQANSTVEISNVVIRELQLLIYGQFLSLSAILPDITQMDLVKNYLQMFGLLPVIDEVQKTIRLIEFDKILANIGSAYDWSDKIDYAEDESLRFILSDYAQKNKFIYTQDGDEKKPLGTDGEINIENENLELEKDVVELIFAGTNSVLRCVDNNIAQIGIFENGEYESEREPRVLNIYRKTLGGDLTLTDGTDTEVISDEIPVPYFIDSERDFNLGFSNNLLENYYELLSNVLNRAKILTVAVRLSAADISQLDFSRPVFIQKFESYFYISSVKGFSYTESKSTLVELVKLNING